ncbi:hypothetical protein Poly30_13110 [Planctomycetes bacterium Poly30]|uniref:FG-GAP repeat protein n=1 Tax=Saltatorellus ferox TaxID=2528018 RepID=A0A518ENZ7_9BACT|nr:hypothetical protein Poly30_13110 [Planctomycetes bacterium Poly30]
MKPYALAALSVTILSSSHALAQCELQRLALANPTQASVLGWSVAIEGDLAAVGSIGTDEACPLDPNCNSGSVQVYRRTAGVWAYEATLTASDGSAAAQFGQNCSISGNRILVGAHFDGPGSAYVFSNSGAGWVEEQKLTGSDSQNLFHFGHCVSLDGDTALIGVMRDNFAGPETGAAFLFERVGGVWTETVKLTASDAAAQDRFGRSCDLKNGIAILGAHLHDGVSPDEGAAYIFERDDAGTPGDPLDDSWPEVAKLVASQPMANELFARAVGLEGDLAVIGASKATGMAPDSGAIYLFQRDANGAWTESQKIVADDGEAADRFGESVAIDGDRIVVGAPGDDDNSAQAGAAYLIERTPLGWVPTLKYTAAGVDASASLGTEMTVDVSGGTALFGAPFSSLDVSIGGGAYLVDLTDCLGELYCAVTANSTGSPGLASAAGSTLATANDLIFGVSSLPTNAFGYVLVSTTEGFVTTPGGSQGNLCLSGQIGRFVNALFNTGATGTGSTSIDLSAVPSPTGPFAAAPGDTLYFQAWHRDAAGGQATSNFTQARRIRLR